MSLYYMSGIGAKAKKAAKKAAKATKKASQPKKKIVAKVALAPSRVAFLAMVTINLGGIAKKLLAGYQKDAQKIKNFWAKFGGDWGKLAVAISKGSKTKISGIGVAPAAAAAAAAPIIVVLVPLLKDLLKGTQEGDVTALENAATEGIKNLAQNPDVEKGDVTMPAGDTTALIKPEADGETQQGSAGIIGASMLMSSLPLYLSIPAGVYLLHNYFTTYAPFSVRDKYKIGFARLRNAMLNKLGVN